MPEQLSPPPSRKGRPLNRPASQETKNIAEEELLKFKKRIPGEKTSFRKIPASKIITLWTTFGRNHDVCPEELGNTGDDILHKIRKILAWSWIYQQMTDEDLADEFAKWISDTTGNPMTTAFHDEWEYDVSKAEKALDRFFTNDTPKTRSNAMYALDRVIHLAHTSGEVASWLIEGGNDTLSRAGAAQPL